MHVTGNVQQPLLHIYGCLAHPMPEVQPHKTGLRAGPDDELTGSRKIVVTRFPTCP